MARQFHLTEQAFSRRLLLKAAAVGSAALAATAEYLRPSGTRAQSGDQVLHVAFDGGIKNYAPGQDTDPYILPFVFMTPLLVDDNNQTSPWLATAVTPNADNTVFTMAIDPRAVWSDGKAVTAQDFKSWYEWIAAPAQKSSAISLVFEPVQGFAELNGGTAQTLDGVVVKDDHTLEYHLTRSEPFFPSRLAMPYSAAARLDQYQADPANVWLGNNANNLIVNGPFHPTAINPEPQGTYVWEQNPKWWGDKKPTLTQIQGQTVRDLQTMLLLFQNGQIDMAFQLSGDPAVQLRKEKPDVFRPRPSFAYFCMDLNVSVEPTNDLNLRQALLRSIDWNQLASVAWEGEMPATTSGNLLPPGMPCRDDTYNPYPFDINSAKDYLSKSKYGSGDKVPKIRLSTQGADTPRDRAAQIVQEFWRTNLGINDVEIKNVETEFGADQGSIAIHTTSAGASLPVPGLLLLSQGSSKGTHEQFTHVNDPELDQAIDGLLKMDPKSDGYCAEVGKVLQLVQDQALTIPLAYIKLSYQVQPWLQNAKVNINTTFYSLMDMSIQK